MIEFLKSFTVGDILDGPGGRERRVRFAAGPVCLDAGLSVHDASQLLAERAISSAPIYDQATSSFIGLLDYHDLLAFVLTIFHKSSAGKSAAGGGGAADAAATISAAGPSFDATMPFKDVLRQGLANGGSTPIRFLANLSHRNPMHVVQRSSCKVLEAVEIMISTKAHRLIVLDGDVFYGVLSATTILEWVSNHFGKFGREKEVAARFPPWKAGQRTLQELGLVQGKVIAVSPDDSLLDALHRMQQNVISSIAIVKDGQLLGNISMTDIKEVFGPHGRWVHIYDSCGAFFTRIRSKQGIENAGRDKVPLFTCTPDMTLADATEKMAGVRAHRLWILAAAESASPVVGVVSLSDVIPLLLQ